MEHNDINKYLIYCIKVTSKSQIRVDLYFCKADEKKLRSPQFSEDILDVAELWENVGSPGALALPHRVRNERTFFFSLVFKEKKN